MKFGGEVDLKPVAYGDPTPDVLGREVYIVDFSYSRTVMEDLNADAASLVCLDHHKTAEEELKGLPYCVFDMDRSGARMAWDYWFPGYKPPWLVLYVEDRDLWRWALPHSQEISASLRTYPWKYLEWYRLAQGGPDKHIEAGKAILKREGQIVDQHVNRAYEVSLAGHKVLAVNATCLHSEIGHALARDRPFGVTFNAEQEGWSFHLRSVDQVNVGHIARIYGGGGHPNAAGFSWLNDHPWDLADGVIQSRGFGCPEQ
jgi:nanoRNase/pAp phosphatase (c-di-AMP/oligoRNAs hydrolase)